MKLPPNFTLQKFTGDPRDKDEQLLYQLQQMYIQIANSQNSEIDDASFFLKERKTSDIWIDGKPIWTYTVATGPLSTGTTSIVLPIKNATSFTLLRMEGSIADSTDPSIATYLPLPYVDGLVGANEIGWDIQGSGTPQAPIFTLNIISSGTDYSAYSGYITVYYTKA